MLRFLAEARAVLVKDLLGELRTRVAVSTLGLFAITILVAVAYAVGPFRISAEDRPLVLATLLWIVLLFAALAGLDRSFVKEEEARTASLLRLAARPLAVWAGKLVLNLVLTYLLMALIVPLFCVLMAYRVTSVPKLVLLLGIGGYALAVVTTMVAAMISRAMTRGALFSVLALPLLLPLLIFLIQGTAAVAGGDVRALIPAVRALISLGGAMTVASALLFPAVWE